MILLTAFQVLLHRVTGQDDVVVGSPIAGRTQPETERLLGFFVNTLALRARLSGNPTLAMVLRQVRETCLGAFDHQELPFEKLVDAVRPARDASRPPLFQVLFSLQNVPPARIELAGLVVEPLRQETSAAKFDLSLYATERADGLRLSFEYAADLFAASTIEYFGQAYLRILETLASDPESRIGDIALVDTDPALHGPSLEIPEATIPSLFDAQARRTPDAVAVRDAHGSVTFAELRARANAVAHRLREHGVGPDVVVAIRCERSVELIVGLLGILNAGGAYLALEPGLPAERQAFMIADSGAALVLSAEDLHLPDQDAHAPHDVLSDNLAYLIYTSGSTGKPKGVLCTHAAAINRFAWMWQTYPFTPDDVCVQKTALSFVDSVWEIWGPLLQGIPLVVLDDATVKDPRRLAAALERHAVTRIVLVPSWLALLVDADQTDLPHLRWCTSSGEALPPELARRTLQRLPHTRLLNLYGSSEVAADVTAYEVQTAAAARIPIGQPIANTRVYVLDSYMQAVPRGAVGEVFVGGPGLARGYKNGAVLTAARFLPDPFGPPGERVYRTGDLGRVRDDGALELLGRGDHQVKVRGYRIELGEIEATLTRHDAIGEAAVVAFGAESHADRRLIAFFVAGQPIAHDELRAFLRRRLPEYMVPASFMQLDALPRTATGKVDRRALRPPAALSDSNNYRAPRTALQHAVVAIWQETLNIERVGVNENFFDLGGNSLLAVRVRARLQEQLSIELPLIDLFRYPTVGTLANYIASSKGADLLHLPARVHDDHYIASRRVRRDARKQHRATIETRRGY